MSVKITLETLVNKACAFYDVTKDELYYPVPVPYQFAWPFFF